MYNLGTTEIRNHIRSGELFKAILEASATLEQLFFSQIIREGKISPDSMGTWALGKLFKKAVELNLIIKKEEYYPIIKDFIELRNIVIHSGQFMLNNLTREQGAGMDRHLIKICEYISLAPVRDEIIDMEEKANEYLEKDVKKNLKFLDEYNRK